MSFTTAENPYTKRDDKHVRREQYFADDGRVFETTGEFRAAKKGEFIVRPFSGLMGPAVAERDTEKPYRLLKQVSP